MPRPDYSRAGVNRDRPAALPFSGVLLRQALDRAGAVVITGDVAAGDVVTGTSTGGFEAVPVAPVETTIILDNLTSDPASPVSGQMWLRTDL